MAYIKLNSSQSAYSRLKYIFDDQSHYGSKERVLDTTGGNIRLWGINGNPYAHQSGYYLNTQFKQLRQHAYNKDKRVQAKHLIISFSELEFNTSDDGNLHANAKQANQLIQSYMDTKFPEAQYVSAVQCDGIGHKLHAHVLINSVAIDGRCVRTNKFEVEHLRNSFNINLEKNYDKVTGKQYQDPFKESQPVSKLHPKGWQANLQFILKWARDQSEDMNQYENLINKKGVRIKKRNKHGDLSYIFNFNGKKKMVRDFYQRIDRKTGKIKSTRGMGLDYTPKALNKYFKNKKSKNKNNFMDDLNKKIHEINSGESQKYTYSKNQRGSQL